MAATANVMSPPILVGRRKLAIFGIIVWFALESFDTRTVGSGRLSEQPCHDRIVLLETFVTLAATQVARPCPWKRLERPDVALETIDDGMECRPFDADTGRVIHLFHPTAPQQSPKVEVLITLLRTDVERQDRRFQGVV